MIFPEKCFSYYFLLTDQISLSEFPLFLEILDNICIAIVYFPGCDVIYFETNVIFLIKLFFYMTKNSKEKFKYLENGKSFEGELKKHFSVFLKCFQSPKNCFSCQSAHVIRRASFDFQLY